MFNSFMALKVTHSYVEQLFRPKDPLEGLEICKVPQKCYNYLLVRNELCLFADFMEQES